MDNRLVYAVALAIGCCILATEGLKYDNIPVGNLTTPISRENCGQTKFCGEIPVDCDPSGNDTCLFVSSAAATTRTKVTKVNFELSGNSDGYIVLILSPDKNLGGNDEAFICAVYHNNVSFFTATFDNGTLTLTNKTGAVSNVWASSIANVIQCKFTALALNATASGGSSDTTFYVYAGNGTKDNKTLENPTILFKSNGSVDLTGLPLPDANTIPVGVLPAPISRVGCGETKLCEEEPADCDPSGNGTCLFVSSAAATNGKTIGKITRVYRSTPTGKKGRNSSKNTNTGTNVAFQLRGNSTGYIALILSPDKNQGGNDEAFVCAQYHYSVRFLTANFNNGTLTVTNKTGAVSNVLASLNNANVIQCTFTALALNAIATRGANTSFYIFAGIGSYDDVAGTLGIPIISLSSNRILDLTDPTSNLPNGGAALHPASLVVLVLLSALISRLV